MFIKYIRGRRPGFQIATRKGFSKPRFFCRPFSVTVERGAPFTISSCLLLKRSFACNSSSQAQKSELDQRSRARTAAKGISKDTTGRQMKYALKGAASANQCLARSLKQRCLVYF
uniref:Uncharacterized protein n=1 Tax=Phlegmariurus squarrosus TaxID=73615 RepID=H9M864_PHLSQ|nr:hypothetical protein HusqMp84 [Phlegmariurus squarrosus]AEV55771.1 hypothetical protein HusqMp84 [Phlegmariurus squarrosus]